jgi:hypothetical protein
MTLESLSRRLTAIERHQKGEGPQVVILVLEGKAESEITAINGASYLARNDNESLESFKWRYHLQELNEGRIGRPLVVFAEFN